MNDFDIYKYLNSADIEKHCRKINHQFGTTEKARLIQMSHLSDEEKLYGYKWLTQNAEDAPIPNIYLNIPHFAMMGGGHTRYTKEERLTRTKTCYGRDSVLDYLKQCTASGEFVELKDGRLNLASVSVNIPHPFKVGDLVEHILTGKAYVVNNVRGEEERRSEFKLWLLYIDVDKRMRANCETIHVQNIQYWHTKKDRRRPLPKGQEFLFHLGKHLKGVFGLIWLLDSYADILMKK
ncbi:MAG: hypothetical protein FWE03_05070 [Firmicutes bacterium]|nr:hypothetical protein [Bacillota bacterium]